MNETRKFGFIVLETERFTIQWVQTLRPLWCRKAYENTTKQQKLNQSLDNKKPTVIETFNLFMKMDFP